MFNPIALQHLGQLASAHQADVNYGDGQYSGLAQQKKEQKEKDIDYTVKITAEGIDLAWLIDVGRSWEDEEYPTQYLFVEQPKTKHNPFSVVKV